MITTTAVITGSTTRYQPFRTCGILKYFAPTAECSKNLSQNLVAKKMDMMITPIGSVISIATKSMNVKKSIPSGVTFSSCVKAWMVNAPKMIQITVTTATALFLVQPKPSAIVEAAPSNRPSTEDQPAANRSRKNSVPHSLPPAISVNT